MAYMNPARKNEITPAVKRVLSKYKIKGTLSVRNHSTLVLSIKSGSIDFYQNWYDKWTAEHARRPTAHQPTEVPDHIDVNVHHIGSHFSGRAEKCLQELLNAMNEGNWNRSDVQADYFDRGWHVSLGIGRWNKPYVFEKVSKGV
jgi:hypothetical protein